MKIKTRLFIRKACFALCAVLLLSFLPCAAAAQELQTIRVGFFAFDGYHMQDENGARSGYGYEILQHMAGYTNWKYEYVGYDKNWSEMQEMLEKGEIDILTSAQKTEERMARFDFSAESIGTSAAILTVKAGDTKYTSSDYINWNGMRVGMIDGNSRNDSFASYAAEKGFSYVPVYYASSEEMVAALKAGGLIDAILTSNLRSIDGEWVLDQFASSPFYIMLQKGNDKLLDEINEALGQMYDDEPGIRTQLMEKYYTPDNGDEIPFTKAEREFIERMKDSSFTAILNPDRAPFSYLNEGELSGILYDIASEIIARSKLDIRFVQAQSRAEYAELVESGNIDLRFDADYNYVQAEQMGYRLTQPYIELHAAKLFRTRGSGTESAALLKNSDITNKYGERIALRYPELVYYDSTDEAVEAVISGKQDVTYLFRRSGELAVQNDITNRLAVENIYGYNNSFAVAVNAKQDHLLYSIINKAVESISQSELEAIDAKYTTYDAKPFSIIGYMYAYPMHIIIFIAALFVVAALITTAIYLAKKRKRDLEQLAQEKRRNGLLADALATAERADAAKSQFLSSVSHEMRTPLNAIIGFIELAKDAPPQKVEEYITNSDIAAKQLLAVINDVLDMSSIESGKLKIAHAPFDFKRMIQATTNIYLPLCRQKGLEFETKILTPVDEWLIGDQLRLNQILMNLLNNAVKFTDKGHIWLEISQHDASDKEAFIRIKVADTGCGMSEEMQARLFKPFEQEDATTARKYGGSGLGLSIVKSLVCMMGGAIKVESSPGKGSAFAVDIPFAKSDIESATAVLDGVENIRALAVDDEALERDYISVVLDRIGIRHTCVEDGNSALKALEAANSENDQYNVCLIDWKMPNLDGIEITRRIREKYGNEVIVIVLSSYEHYQADDEARIAGANMFISKPLFQSTLFDMFATLTGGRIAKKETAPVKHDFSGKRVLLAEDNAMNRMVAEGLIKKLGAACETASDGRIAADKFIASEPGYYDAILMDIQMPNMDGFEATRVIRGSAHPDAENIHIVALTANAFNEDIAKALSNGMNAHVAKPIEPALLAEALEKAFIERADKTEA